VPVVPRVGTAAVGVEYMFDAHGTAHAVVGHDAGSRPMPPPALKPSVKNERSLIGADDVP
jgi:hypothetical protein